MALAYFALVSITVAGFVLNGKNVKRQATHDAAVQRCMASRPVLSKVSRHFLGVNELAAGRVQDLRDALAASPRGDPLVPARQNALQRALKAQRDIAAASGLPVPTIAQCHDLP